MTPIITTHHQDTCQYYGETSLYYTNKATTVCYFSNGCEDVTHTIMLEGFGKCL